MQKSDDKLNLCQVMVKILENENSWVLNIVGLFVNNYLKVFMTSIMLIAL